MKLNKIKNFIMKYCNLGKLKTMTTLEKLDLLDKLNRYDESVSRLIDIVDISKHILLPKWKIWLFLRIFGEKKCECDDSFATQALDLFDDALDWSELPFEAQIAAYKNNENFITAAIYYDKVLRKEIGSLNEVLDQLSELVPNKVSVNNTVYFKDSKTLKFECWAKFKRVLGIEVSKNYKTSISYFDKEVFPCKGLENETVMGPKWNRVMVAPIVAEIFRQIGVLDDDQNNNKKEEKIEMDNSLEKKFTNFFKKEEERMDFLNNFKKNMGDKKNIEKEVKDLFFRETDRFKDFVNSFDSFFSCAPGSRIKQLFNDIFKTFDNIRLELVDKNKCLDCCKQEQADNEKSEEDKELADNMWHRIKTEFDHYPSKSKKSFTINKVVSKPSKEDAFYNWVDGLCFKIVKFIQNNKDLSKKKKDIMILSTKLYLFSLVLVGPDNASSFLNKLNEIDEEFSIGVGNQFSKSFKSIIDEYQKSNPEFKLTDSNYASNYCTLSSAMLTRTNNTFERKVILGSNKFTMNIVSKKKADDDAPKITIDIHIPDPYMMDDVLNVTSFTKLYTMFKFVMG